MQVGHATADPEVPEYRVGLAADQARRPALRTESSEPLADFVNLWPLIGQITRGNQRSDASLKLLVAHCHFFAAASIEPMTIVSMFLPDRMACWLSFSASSRRSSSVRTSLTSPGIPDGFARRAMATLAATSGSRTRGRCFRAASGSSGCPVPEPEGLLRLLTRTNVYRGSLP